VSVVRRLWLGSMLAGLLAAAGPATDARFERRFESFVAAGYDPLTVPVDWFEPTERVAGGNAAHLEVKPTKTIAPTALATAAAYAAAANSTALLVAQGDDIIYERYWRGDGPDSLFNPQSMSKTLVALLVGIAIDEGRIRSVEDPVERYVREWRGDPRGKITVEQLLRMSSGLAQLQGKHGYALTRDNPAVYQHFGSDFVKPILGLRLAAAPGTKWDYNNNATNLLGVVLERATGKRYAALLSEKLWRPLGNRDARLYLDREGGFPMVSCCVFSRPRDWVRVGQLIAGRGEFGGKRLVPAAWIDHMTTPAPTYRGYGYQIWLGDQKVGGAPLPVQAQGLSPWQSEPFAAEDMIFLNGHGFQRVWIIPSRDLVIVRAGKSWPSEWDEAAIPNSIVRGMTGETAR
jgi:CubicO group peptidase (beta-lactamase class C family)